MKFSLTALLAAAAFLSAAESAMIGEMSQTHRLSSLQLQEQILRDLIDRDCPGRISKRSVADVAVEVHQYLVRHLQEVLVECRLQRAGQLSSEHENREGNNVVIDLPAPTEGRVTTARSSMPATSTTPAPTPTTPAPTPTTPAPTPTPSCTYSSGFSKMLIDLISYENPSDTKATGSLCDGRGDLCDVYLEICVSEIGSRNCSLLNTQTDVIDSNTVITFPSHLGGLSNPVQIEVKDYQGVNIQVTVMDRDPAELSDDMIDEFTYDITDLPGSAPRMIELDNWKKQPKSRVVFHTRVHCPLTTTPPTTTAPTTTTAAPTTTTVDPNLQICQSSQVIELTDSSKLERNNQALTQGKRESNWLAGKWFRFTQAAGDKLADTCPPEYSCGDRYPLWSEDTMPSSVGQRGSVRIYMRAGVRCKHSSWTMQVIRCGGGASDLIYKINQSYHPFAAVCGMRA